MRERNREIKRRRHRQEKRRRLRKKLAAITNDTDRQHVQDQIRKTYPRNTPEMS
ncbi:MAG TPA: DUF6800 family protein [Blastocatellia bacterium]|nr:DUF6800 family protein [Blastocatellia bacterium]